MTEEAIQVTDGIEVRGYDLEGINRLLSTNDAGLPGIAVLVMGQEDGEHVSVVCGEPVGQSIVSAADTSLKRAAVVLLSTHYDMRHAGYLHAGIMSGIARSRGLEPRDEETARRINADASVLPFGDVPRMAEALEAMPEAVNRAIRREIYKGVAA